MASAFFQASSRNLSITFISSRRSVFSLTNISIWLLRRPCVLDHFPSFLFKSSCKSAICCFKASRGGREGEKALLELKQCKRRDKTHQQNRIASLSQTAEKGMSMTLGFAGKGVGFRLESHLMPSRTEETEEADTTWQPARYTGHGDKGLS